MSVDNLIRELSQDVQPVKRLSGLGPRFAMSLVLALVFAGFGIYFWFVRKGEFNIPAGRSLVEAGLILACFLAADWHAVRSVSPHTASPRLSRREWALFAIWMAVIAGAFASAYQANPSEALIALQYNTWACPMVIFSIALPAAGTLLYLLRQGAILYPRNTVLSWSLGTLALGLLGLAFICPWADPLHELLWHVIPSVLGVIILAAIGRYALGKTI